MAVEWLDGRVAYFATPKAACTSAKLIFYYLNNGVAFTDDYPELRNGQIHSTVWGTPHFQYATPYRYSEWDRICIVRDPIKRFLSAYQNRIQHFGELDARRAPPETLKWLSDLGLVERPTIEQFIMNFHKYCAVSETINHHFLPQSQFIGADLSFYSHVFRIDRLDELERYLSLKAAEEITFPTENRSKMEGALAKDLPPRLRRYVSDLYAGDYALLKGHFLEAFPRSPRRKEILNSDFFYSVALSEQVISGSASVDERFQVYVDGFTGELIVSRAGNLSVKSLRPREGSAENSFVGLEFRSDREIRPNGVYTLELTIEASTAFEFGIIVRDIARSGTRVDIGSTNKTAGPGLHRIDVEMDVDGLPEDFETESQWVILYFSLNGSPDFVCRDITISEIV